MRVDTTFIEILGPKRLQNFWRVSSQNINIDHAYTTFILFNNQVYQNGPAMSRYRLMLEVNIFHF